MGRRLTTADFVARSLAIHGDKYDYSLVEYVNNRTKVKLWCPKHGVFQQPPDAHLSGKGCDGCRLDKMSETQRRDTTADFVQKSLVIHGDKYDYSQVEYTTSRDKVVIVCPNHGEFSQTPNNHLNGKGCPTCCSSTGEKEIAKWLLDNKVSFEAQKRFEGCRDGKPLSFDFFLPGHQMLLEYDGLQHFQPVDFFGGEAAFVDTKKRDEIKDSWAAKNSVRLIRIPYTAKDNIPHTLASLIKEQD